MSDELIYGGAAGGGMRDYGATKVAPVFADTFIRPDKPFKPRQVRIKTWRLPVVFTGDITGDPVWASRCEQYWVLQQQKYGVKLEAFEFHQTVEEGVPILVTSARVDRVLPGRRVSMNKFLKEANA